MSRLILLVLVVGVGLWLYKISAGGLLGTTGVDPAPGAPVERARDAAHRSEARQTELVQLGREASSNDRESGRVLENMTPSEVRAMMGDPDEVTSGISASGAPQETWIYRRVGKRVVFENGVAVSVGSS
jgi:hypothetical protein